MQHRRLSRPGVILALFLGCGLAWIHGVAQATIPDSPGAAQAAVPNAAQTAPNSVQPPQILPGSASAPALHARPERTVAEREAARISALAKINGRPYDPPTHKVQFHDYLRDSYGLPALARSTVRSLYSEARDGPSGWGQDFPGFMQRLGSNIAITAIDGNVRYGMETVFHEDMRYIPCHGCSVRRKIQNALLSEVTARHDADGHRFFTLTPAIADFSGPIIANAAWYPNHDPFGGVVGTRTVAATRVGSHLFTEFVLERRHHDKKIEDTEPLRVPPKPDATPSH
jgi:hypothetical protein